MTLLRRLALLLPCVRHRKERGLEEELASYLAMAQTEACNRGLSPEAARTAARRDLGNVTVARESVRSVWIWPSVEHLWQDIGYLLRSLCREPLFACIAIGSLAFGIAAANTVFSLLDGILLKPLAYVQPGQLVYLREFVPALSHVYGSVPVNFQHFRFWQEHSRAFSGMAAFRSSGGTLTNVGDPIKIEAVETTSGLFRVLGTKFALGRGFLPDEDKRGHSQMLVISDSLWRTRFRADSAVIGRNVVWNGKPAAIIGVLPPDFRFPSGNELGELSGLGKRIQAYETVQSPLDGWDGDFDYSVFARLRNGITLAGGLNELAVLTQQFTAANKVVSKPRPEATPLQEVIGGSVRGSLWVLFASVLVLLLIVCANLANLMLARAHGRIREFSIRTALGAGRTRLIQQILTEALFLSAAGGILGIALAVLLIHLIKLNPSYELPRMGEVNIDGRVMLFSLFATILCACVCGVLPALRASRSDLAEAMRSAGPTITAGYRSLRLRQTLVGCEVALSTVLVFLAGLLISSLINVLHVNKGFDEKHATAIKFDLPEARYQDTHSRSDFYERALAGASSLSGIRSAAIVQGLPLTGESMVNGIELEGTQADWIDPATKAPIMINVRFVSPSYFETLGIPLIVGRTIEDRDRNAKVTVVSKRLAAKIWPNRNPLGRKFKTGSRVGEVQVVGVVGDTYNGRLDQQPTLIAYVPFWIRPPDEASLVFRTVGSPKALIPSVQRVLRSLDSALPVSEVQTLSEIVSAASARRRFQVQLAAFFGFAAFLLALIGIYGVVSYYVEQRKGELGLRLALGARRVELIRLIMRYALAPVVLGLGCGLLLSLALGGLLRGLVFGIGVNDPATLAAITLSLIGASALACFVPASRVMGMNPASILRHE